MIGSPSLGLSSCLKGGLLDAGVGLLIAEPAGLPRQGTVDHGDGQEVVALVGSAGVAAPLGGCRSCARGRGPASPCTFRGRRPCPAW